MFPCYLVPLHHLPSDCCPPPRAGAPCSAQGSQEGSHWCKQPLTGALLSSAVTQPLLGFSITPSHLEGTQSLAEFSVKSPIEQMSIWGGGLYDFAVSETGKHFLTDKSIAANATALFI